MALLKVKSAPARILGACLALLAGALTWAAPPAKEYQLKAAFLFNFSQYAEWPPDIFAAAKEPLVIGIFGSDPFGNFLDDLVRGEEAHDRPLIIQRFRRVEDIQACHVLFISQAEAGKVNDILARYPGQSVLTVGETKGFTEAGGIIQFINENNRIRFRINVAAAKAANIKISSKLLRRAEIVGEKKE